MTVEIKSQRSKTDLPAPRAPDVKDILAVDPLQQGQALLAANKKRKKQQKRSGLYNFLSQSNTIYYFSCGVYLCFDFLRWLHQFIVELYSDIVAGWA